MVVCVYKQGIVIEREVANPQALMPVHDFSDYCLRTALVCQRVEKPGSTIGALFRVVTFGESHGPAIGAVIEGCPPGIELSAVNIQRRGRRCVLLDDDVIQIPGTVQPDLSGGREYHLLILGSREFAAFL